MKNWPKPPVPPNPPTSSSTNQAERTAETRVSIIEIPPENPVPTPPRPELDDTLVNVDISLAVGKNLSDADVHRFMERSKWVPEKGC